MLDILGIHPIIAIDDSSNSDRTLDNIIKQLIKNKTTLLNNVQCCGKVKWI